MKTVRLFLASSGDLDDVRSELERFIHGACNQQLNGKGLRISEVVRWEGELLSLSHTAKQDDLDARLRTCEIVFVIVRCRVGPYTVQEFELAYDAVREGRPVHLFVFMEKRTPTGLDSDSVGAFKVRLAELKQIAIGYADIHDLELQISHQLHLLADRIGEPGEAVVGAGLPPRPEPFVNRTSEQAEARRLLGSGAVVHIKAPAGMGKSFFVAHLAHQLRNTFPGGVFHISPFKGLDDAVCELLSCMGVGVRQGQEREQRAALKRHLGASEKPVLIILDNVSRDQTSEVEALLALRHQHPVVITSRSDERLSFSGERVVLLKEFSPEDSRQLLDTLTGRREAEIEMTRLCERVPGIPLVLRIAASRLGEWEIKAGELAEWLAKGPSTLVDSEQQLQAALDYSYDLLPEAERRLFGMLSVLGEDSFDADAIRAIAARPDAEAVVYCRLFPQLVQRVGERRFHLHPYIREFAARRCDPADRGLAQQRMVRHFLNVLRQQSDPAGVARLRTERLNLRAARQHLADLNDDALTVQFASALIGHDAYDGFYGRNGLWREGIATAGIGIEAAIRLGDSAHEALFLRDRGQYAYWLGDLPAARRDCEAALSRIGAGQGQRGDVIRLQHVLGYIADDEDRYADASEHYGKALELAEHLQDPELIALGHHLLAVVDYHLRRIPKARAGFARALEIIAGIERKAAMPEEQAKARAVRARCQRRFAALVRAEAQAEADPVRRSVLLHEAADRIQEALTRETGARSRARGLRQQGMILEEQGDLSGANDCYLEAGGLFADTGNLKGSGTVAFNLGNLAERSGDWPAARRQHLEAIRIAQDVQCRHGEALSRLHLARIAKNTGDHREARSQAEGAGQIFEAIGSPFQRDAIEFLRTLPEAGGT